MLKYSKISQIEPGVKYGDVMTPVFQMGNIIVIRRDIENYKYQRYEIGIISIDKGRNTDDLKERFPATTSFGQDAFTKMTLSQAIDTAIKMFEKYNLKRCIKCI